MLRMNQAFLLSLAALTSLSLTASAAEPQTTAASTAAAPAPAAALQSTPAPITPAAQPTLSGQVSIAAPAAPAAANTAATTAADYLALQLTPQSKQDHLQTFTVAIQNKQAKHLELMQIEVTNGLSEQMIQQNRMAQQERSAAKRRVAGGLLRGITSIGTSFIPYAGVGSYAAYQGIHAGTQAAYMTASAIENNPNGASAASYAGQVVQRANNILISPNQTFQCLAVVPEGQTPVLKVIFKDLQTNQILEVQK